jgi:hypothetical protein
LSAYLFNAAARRRLEAHPTIENITIDGDTATAIIKDATSTNTVTFVTEGDQIKVSSSKTS